MMTTTAHLLSYFIGIIVGMVIVYFFVDPRR